MGGDAHPNEQRVIAKAKRVQKPRGCSAEMTGWEGERVDRLCFRSTSGPLAWRGLKSDGLGGKSMGWYVMEGGRRFMAVWRK